MHIQKLIKVKIKFLHLYKYFFTVIFTLFIFCTLNNILFANGSSDNKLRFLNLTKQLRCPTCQGLSIKDSEAVFSKVIKGKILELINNGKSEKEILNYFVKRYGNWILRSPPKEGFNLILWVIPSVGIFLGLLWVFLRFKIWDNTNEEKKLKKLTKQEEEKVMEDLKIFESD